jgi:hypothetical protein
VTFLWSWFGEQLDLVSLHESHGIAQAIMAGRPSCHWPPSNADGCNDGGHGADLHVPPHSRS